MTRPSTPWGNYPWDPQQAPAPAAAAIPSEATPTVQPQQQAGQQVGPPVAAPTPALGEPTGGGGNYTVDQMTASSRQAVDQAQSEVDAIWGVIKPLQLQYQSVASPTLPDGTQNPNYDLAKAQTLGTQLTQQLNAQYQDLAQAQSKLQSANTAYSSSIQAALKTATVDPAQAQYYLAQSRQADASAYEAQSRADILQQGSQGQRDLVSAQIGQTSDNAALQRAQAAVQNAIATQQTPAQVQALQGQAAQAQASANSTTALIQPLVDKTRAETGLTQAQIGLTGSQSDYYQAQTQKAGAETALTQAQANLTAARTPGEVGVLGAQAGLYGAQAGLAGAQASTLTPAQAAAQYGTAAEAMANVQKAQLGPLYGLQDQINAIRSIQQQVFGPGGSGSPQDRSAQANDLLNQFTSATIGGTTPYAAATTAAGAQQQQFGTQASLANAAQAAMASRANALQGAAASAFGQLAQMNANAPAGSTAMAGAFKDVLSQLGAAGNQYAPPPQMPTPPQLPSFLQQFSGPTGGGGGGGAAPSGSGSNAPVTINIGGQGQGQTAGPPPPAAFNPNPTAPGTNAAAGLTPGGGGMPAMLQGMMPLSAQQASDYWHQLWAPELSSGAVTSPYASMGQPTPYVGTGALPPATGPGAGTPPATSMYY